MATSRDYNRAADSKDTETTSTRVKDRAQIHRTLKEAGLNPSDYIFSPLPQDHLPKEPASSHTSAFSSYRSHQRQDNQKVLKPQSQSLFTSGRPLAYVQRPPPPPPQVQSSGRQPPPSNRDQAPPTSQLSNSQQQGSQPQPPPSQSGASMLQSLFGRSAPNTQNTTSQPPPSQPPPSQPPPSQSGPSMLQSLFNRPAPNAQNTTSQPPPNTNQQSLSPQRSPPPPPPHISSHPQDSTLSAQQYLHQINSRDNPPVRVVKPNTQNVVYRKEIRIRYLQPPTPPPPAPIIIREKHMPLHPPQSPLLIRERKPEARTPPPLTIRERPPTPPPPLEPYIIEKNLPPPPPQPRQIIIERLPTPPPKPRTVIFEKWLPYKKVKRPVLLQKAPPREPIKPTRNVVIEYEPLKAFTVRRVIEEGVFRVDPHQFASYNSRSQPGGGDVRIVERIDDLPPPSEQLLHALNDYKFSDQHSSTNLNTAYNSYPGHSSSEHIPPDIQHLLSGARPASQADQLTNVARASNTPAYRQERVLSGGYSSSRATPVIVPIQRSHSKSSSNHSSRHITPHDSPIRSHIEDLY